MQIFLITDDHFSKQNEKDLIADLIRSMLPLTVQASPDKQELDQLLILFLAVLEQ